MKEKDYILFTRLSVWVTALTSLVIFLFAVMPAYGQNGNRDFLDKGSLDLINEAVMEVVVLKPEKDSLTYEKPLPMELIPYSIRVDKYYSIGTAFALGPDTFVSASHVMNLDHFASQFGAVHLRDRAGNVYEIEKITKFSDHRDYAVFSLKDKTAERYFQVNTNPSLNDRVYAVGNALGEGIVVRDGLYVNDTPEEYNGEWKWIRFSAAASSGNSGGPLLDSDGKVIGIVLGKSENENMNFALPISEVMNAPDNTALSFAQLKYTIENMDYIKYATFDEKIPLPMAHADLQKELVSRFHTFGSTLMKDFLKENEEKIFPRGEGSTLLLHNMYTSFFPGLIARGRDGSWGVYSPEEKSKSDLGANGYMYFGAVADSVLMYIRKPDNITIKDFYTDSRLFMDITLKGIYYSREIADEKIRVTSIGKAVQDYPFVDSYGRKWLVRIWRTEYDDEAILTFNLPVPGGFISVLKAGQTGRVEAGYLEDMKLLADFIYVSYYGTYTDWQEFLGMEDLLPKAFKDIGILFKSDGRLVYRSKRLKFTQPMDVQEVSQQSDLKLVFDYFPDGDKVVWDVRAIVVGEHKNNSAFFSLYRMNHPSDSLNDSYKVDWDNIVNRKFPYNALAKYKDGNTLLELTHPHCPEGGKAGSAPFCYTVMFQSEGSMDGDEAAGRIHRVAESIQVLE